MDLYQDAVEGRKEAGVLTDTLALLSAKATRSVGVVSRDAGDYAAGRVIFHVTD